MPELGEAVGTEERLARLEAAVGAQSAELARRAVYIYRLATEVRRLRQVIAGVGTIADTATPEGPDLLDADAFIPADITLH